ncbi:MAG: hydrogenase [Deltaproteobacteria bacterium CG_4_10_14_3_um_filter_60_8]|nr:MAG: hydrogenase [Desulfobacterales bacterium CG2_30_60_27]PIP43326.1 MAG: hydrogenase [Deltaproteobacteria bacterium CG23_combo_of_CG06-09_8_20_14_all_60_8]PIY20839.1 MAG: hydrogenase [Deltaproteobacteria bacterium CG_4_10_14_3_um_filter_60_8]
MITRLFLHLLVLFALAPLLPGVIGKTKALFGGRKGAPFLQHYFNLWKLFGKGLVISRTTTWIFRTGPVVGLAVPVIASLFVPFGSLTAPLGFNGDMIFVIYLFALSRFCTATAALDTGSAFEGMGAAREVTFACLAEPALFFSLIVIARLTGSLSLTEMLGPGLLAGWHGAAASLILVLVCLFVVVLVENCRIPFDDPNTHLELTMIHEVMVLDHSGPDLALIFYGAAMKLLVLGAVVVRVAIPVNLGNQALDLGVFILGMIGLAVLIGVIESIMARLQLLRIPQFLIGTILLSFFSLIMLLR